LLENGDTVQQKMKNKLILDGCLLGFRTQGSKQDWKHEKKLSNKINRSSVRSFGVLALYRSRIVREKRHH